MKENEDEEVYGVRGAKTYYDQLEKAPWRYISGMGINRWWLKLLSVSFMMQVLSLAESIRLSEV